MDIFFMQSMYRKYLISTDSYKSAFIVFKKIKIRK